MIGKKKTLDGEMGVKKWVSVHYGSPTQYVDPNKFILRKKLYELRLSDQMGNTHEKLRKF